MSGGRVRRVWRRRSVKVVAGLVALVLVLTVAAAGWLVYRYRQLHRVDVAGLTEAESGEPQNLLLVGSDSRAFVDGTADVSAYGTEDEVGEPHADTILLVRVFPDLHRVAMVSIPRDPYVPIAGTGGEDRINAAVQGGPDRLVQTISDDFGVEIHHYATIDFRGFKGVVNAVGGVEVYFPAPARDFDTDLGRTLTGLDIPNPGCIRLDGDQALAYVRSRHYQQLVDGEWQSDPAGDLNRIQRQQDFIRRTFRQSLSKGLLDPRRIDKLLTAARDNVTLDQQVGFTDVRSFGSQFHSLKPDALDGYTLPTTPFTTGAGAQVLRLDAVAADPILDVFRGKTVQPVVDVPSSVRLRVENGSGRPGETRAAAYRLAAAGFAVTGIGDAPRSPTTIIRYGAGQEAAATLVRARVVGPVELRSEPELQGIDVVLVVGRDWKGVTEETAAAATTTSTTVATTETTAPPSTTTTDEVAPGDAGSASC
jgi:LCP family protein required for cell wall assembly